MRFTKMGMLAAAVAGLLVGASGVRANSIVPSLSSATLSAGVWTYVYSISENAPNAGNQSRIDSGTASTISPTTGGTAVVTNGDFFELVDFAGYVAGSASASALTTAGGASWQISIANLQLVPVTGATVPDSAADSDVIFQYIGSGNGILGAQSLLSGNGTDLAIGTITLKSTIAPTTLGDHYNAQDFNTTSPGSNTANNGLLDGPVSAPLPSAAWMGVSSLLLAGLAGAVRKRIRNA